MIAGGEFEREELDTGFLGVPHGLWTCPALNMTDRVVLGWLWSHLDSHLAKLTRNGVIRAFKSSSAGTALDRLGAAGYIRISRAPNGQRHRYRLLAAPWKAMFGQRPEMGWLTDLAGSKCSPESVTEPKSYRSGPNRSRIGNRTEVVSVTEPKSYRVEDHLEEHLEEHLTPPTPPLGSVSDLVTSTSPGTGDVHVKPERCEVPTKVGAPVPSKRFRPPAHDLDGRNDPLFSAWWDAFPLLRREARRNCYAKWLNLAREPVDYQLLIEQARQLTEAIDLETAAGEKNTAPLPMTWLNQRRWETDLTPRFVEARRAAGPRPSGRAPRAADPSGDEFTRLACLAVFGDPDARRDDFERMAVTA